MSTRKALVLARGLGTRMQQDGGAALAGDAAKLAAAGLKGLIPVAGRPFLDYLFAVIVEAGFKEACLVIGPDGDALKAYGTELSKRAPIDIYFAVQKEAKGTADAVAAGEGFAEGESFVMLNSDNWIPAAGLKKLRECRGMDESSSDAMPQMVRPGGDMGLRDTGYEEEFGDQGQTASDDTAFGITAGIEPGFVLGFERAALAAGNIPADRIKRFAVLDIAPDFLLNRVIEKPDNPEQYARDGKLYVSMNCWYLPPSIFEACRSIQPSPRGELEITDAVQWLVDNDKAEFRVLTRNDPVFDMTGREDVASITKALAGYKIPFPPPKG